MSALPGKNVETMTSERKTTKSRLIIQLLPMVSFPPLEILEKKKIFEILILKFVRI